MSRFSRLHLPLPSLGLDMMLTWFGKDCGAVMVGEGSKRSSKLLNSFTVASISLALKPSLLGERRLLKSFLPMNALFLSRPTL